MFRALPDPYIVFSVDDPTFTIIEESEAHAVISMVQRKNIIGKPLFEVYPDMTEKYRKTGVSDLQESIRKVIRTGKIDDMSTMRYDLKNRQGMYEERYFKVTHHPVFAPDKRKVIAVVQSTADVTESTIADRRLLETERQLAEALDIAQVGTWIWDLVADKIVADKNLSRMFGMSETQGAQGLPVSSFMEAIHVDDRDRVAQEIAISIERKELFDTEYRTIDKNGIVHWLLVRGRIETDASGKPIRFPGVLLDITERKYTEITRNYLVQASTVLTGSLNYKHTLKSIATLAVPDVADWCTVEVLEDDVLHQVAVAHKDPRKLAWAKSLYDLMHQTESKHPTQEDTLAYKVCKTRKPVFIPQLTQEMVEHMSSNEQRRDIARKLEVNSVIAVPLLIENKAIGAITLILSGPGRQFNKADLNMATELANHASLAIANARLYDETRAELRKRVQLEEKLRTINDELEQRVKDRTKKLEASNIELNRSNKELQDFAYVASHDLQEPLRKIQAFGNLLEQEYGDKLDDGADYLHRMQKAAARMSSLISDLLSFSRVTTKEQDFETVNLKTVALEVVEDLYARITDTDGMVHIGNLPSIDADPLQMRQLLQNLIGNALKFHKPDTAPQVTVAAKMATVGGARSVTLSVSDNGVGFDQKYQDRIFAVFQRLHNRETYEGTGIGLAVCRKIVERHHGTITTTSQLDVGSTFTVTLPVSQKRF